jgi:hypothetical protein
MRSHRGLGNHNCCRGSFCAKPFFFGLYIYYSWAITHTIGFCFKEGE